MNDENIKLIERNCHIFKKQEEENFDMHSYAKTQSIMLMIIRETMLPMSMKILRIAKQQYPVVGGLLKIEINC